MMTKLRRLNVVAACLHAAAAVGFGVYLYRATDATASDDNELSQQLALRKHHKTRGSDVAINVRDRGIAAMVVAFFVVTAIAHALYAADVSQFYSNAVRAQNSWFRWIEYGISATIMVVVISITAGVKDVYTVGCLAALTAVIMATGQWFETSPPKHRIVPLVVGFGALAVIWAVVIASYLDRVAELEDDPDAPPIPKWIIGAVVTTLVFFSLFGAVPVVAMYWKVPYEKTEMAYLVLSATAKISLAGFLAYGLGERSRASNE